MPPSEPAVLVVAADPATASHLGAPLTSAGYAVEMAAEIPEAQARLRAGGIDLVVLHVAAPAPAHRAFCAWVRQQVGDLYLPLIVVRAAPTAADRQPLCAAGADECLDEPLAPADLLARVQVWMRVRQRLRAAPTAADRQPLCAAGADECLDEPLAPADLLARVQVWMRVRQRLRAACDRLMGQHAALRASDARLRELLENLDAIVWEADAASWQIVFVSSRATALLGYPTTQWLTEPAFWRRIVHPEDRETVARWLAAAPAGDARESEFRVLAADGRVVWLHHLLYLAPPDPAHPCRLCGISFDITARKQLEERLHQGQKLESIGRLAGGIAHDFNNLLTVINGFSEVLWQQLAPAAPHRAYVAEIAKAGERAAALTQQLLAFSRRQVLQPRVLDLNAIVTDTSTILRRLIGEDIALELRLAPGLAAVYADPAQLSQVLLNLAVNARDAMPQGGRLTIQTANVVVDTTFAARHPPTQPGTYVQLAVTDTGCGMPPEVQAHIFEPFFTTKERGHGTGLGLATVYGIVKQSGGYVWVESAPGRGTTVAVYLPPAAQPADPPAPTPPAPRALHGTDTILLVEDEEQVRALAQTVLTAYGYTVLAAASGEAALALSQRHPGPVHLLLTDVVLPGISGRELADRLRAQHPAVRVLYMSGYVDDMLGRRGIMDSRHALLPKPFTPQGLAERVRAILDQPSAGPPAGAAACLS